MNRDGLAGDWLVLLRTLSIRPVCGLGWCICEVWVDWLECGRERMGLVNGYRRALLCYLMAWLILLSKVMVLSVTL